MDLIIFILGLLVGSFLNCIVYWLEKKKRKNLLGRSFCPHCSHPLGFFDLIPLLSFIFLRGKCRYCGRKISWHYPLVELLTGLVFLLIFNYYSAPGEVFFLIVVSSLLIIVFSYDLKHCLIPSKVVYLGIIITFFKFNLLSGLGMALFFFLIWLVSKGKWMGFGDVELAFLIGLLLGWPNVLTALFSAFLIGAIMGLVLMIFEKKKLKSRLPFGPFLVTGAFIGLFFGERIINWYLSLAGL